MAYEQTVLNKTPEATSDRASSPTSTPDRRRRRGAFLLLGAALAGLVLLLALPHLAGSSSQTAGVDRDPSVEVEGQGGQIGDGRAPAGGDQSGDGTGGAGESGGGSSEEPEVGQPEGPAEPEGPEQPEPEVEPVPATLKASPDPVKLGPGVYSGSFTVANVGDQAMTWSALSKPSVSLSDTGGQLAGKSSTIVSFTVDKATLSPGAFSFKIKVTGNGGTTYVDVHGFKPFDQIIPKA